MSKLKAIAAVVSLSLCLLAALPGLPAAAGTGEGIGFIRQNQMPDGGFTEPGRSAGADATTAWCIMALKAGGTDPRQVKNGGRSPVDFLASQAQNWHSVTDYERTLLAAAAAGEDPRSFGGVDLVAKVQSHQKAGGNIGDAINSNAFGILSYKAAGVAVPPGAVDWHVRNQNGDGGWGNDPGAASNPDMTAASVMALRAAGVSEGDPSIQSAFGYLHSIQNGDGGFSFQQSSSDVSATAWCVQAIVAAGQDPAGAAWSKNGNTPYGFVASMQATDGHFYWMEGADRNPVWTTAYAVCAIARKPYPVGVSYSASPGEQESGGSGSGSGSETAPPAQGGGGQQQEEGASEAEAEEVTQEDTGGGEADETQVSANEAVDDVGEEEEAKAGAKAEAARERNGDEPSGGTSFLVWLIPLVVAVPLLSLGGWRLYRRFI
ncbi:MAG: hypothetical protein JW854_13920 [Actinobacteria bacterium]|nr:hypothetical protein [Actinomycetota bacterium]